LWKSKFFSEKGRTVSQPALSLLPLFPEFLNLLGSTPLPVRPVGWAAFPYACASAGWKVIPVSLTRSFILSCHDLFIN
jgi:hypothetical protein